MNEIKKKNMKQKPNVTVSRAWSWTAPMQNVWDMKWKKSENASHLICCAPLRMRLQLETGVRSIASAENWSKSQISSGNITRIYLPWNKNKIITIIAALQCKMALRCSENNTNNCCQWLRYHYITLYSTSSWAIFSSVPLNSIINSLAVDCRFLFWLSMNKIEIYANGMFIRPWGGVLHGN